MLLCGGCPEKSALVHGLQVIVILFWTVDVFFCGSLLSISGDLKGGNYR